MYVSFLRESAIRSRSHVDLLPWLHWRPAKKSVLCIFSRREVSAWSICQSQCSTFTFPTCIASQRLKYSALILSLMGSHWVRTGFALTFTSASCLIKSLELRGLELVPSISFGFVARYMVFLISSAGLFVVQASPEVPPEIKCRKTPML
jgi:hypothetical protein